MPDQRIFDPGTRVNVLVNWNTFLNWGFLSRWKKPMFQVVHNACQAWNNCAGTTLRFSTIRETTTLTSLWDLSLGELLIIMDEALFSAPGIMATGGGSFADGTPITNRSSITFYRKNYDLTPWNWTLGHGDPAQNTIDFQGVLMHELGHACGLQEHSLVAGDLMSSGYAINDRYGPYKNDIARLRQLYTPFAGNKLKSRCSFNGQTWHDRENWLTKHSGNGFRPFDARTNQQMGVVALPKTPLYFLSWDNPDQKINGCWGDGQNFLKLRGWRTFYPGTLRTIYGSQLASDEAGNIFWAWVDDDQKIHIWKSDDNGLHWTLLSGLPDLTTSGAPGLCCTLVNNTVTWILCWVHLNRTIFYDSELGKIKYSLSQDNGTTWSTPQVLYPSFDGRVQGGVSIAAADQDHILVLFALAPWGPLPERVNMLHGFRCAFNAGQLNVNRIYADASLSRLNSQPAIVYQPANHLFLTIFRDTATDFIEKGSLKKLGISSQTNAASEPQTMQQLKSNVPPVLCSSKAWHEIVLWFAEED